jgi:hypothetical protein
MSPTFGSCKTNSQTGFHDLTFEQEGPVSFNARKSLAWPAMILAGLTLGGYVVTAWPDGDTAPAQAQPLRVTSSDDSEPARTLASVTRAGYPGDLIIYELESTLLVDSIMATPQRVDAH